MMRQQPGAMPLVLDGEQLSLEWVELDGAAWSHPSMT